MPKETSPTASNEIAPVARFEQSMTELEKIVQTMENGELSLDASLQAYERGMQLYRECQHALDHAQLRIQQLADPERPQLSKPFDPSTAGP